MKPMIRSMLGLAVLTAALNSGLYADTPAAGFVDFGTFTPSASGGEFVEVNISRNLIALVSQLTAKSEPQVTDLLRGLQQIRVNVVGLTDENRASAGKQIKAIRARLDSEKWERIVTVQQTGQDVGVYLKTRGGEAVEGLVVTILQGNREAVLVNIVGNIKPEQVALLGERFNIEPLKKVGQTLEKK
jgi:hypothetical protein